jgi:hypothetical protein
MKLRWHYDFEDDIEEIFDAPDMIDGRKKFEERLWEWCNDNPNKYEWNDFW